MTTSLRIFFPTYQTNDLQQNGTERAPFTVWWSEKILPINTRFMRQNVAHLWKFFVLFCIKSVDYSNQDISEFFEYCLLVTHRTNPHISRNKLHNRSESWAIRTHPAPERSLFYWMIRQLPTWPFLKQWQWHLSRMPQFL